MRRLPVYLLLDTSGSMYGEPIKAVRDGVKLLVDSLRQDPYALETVFLSVITFNNSARQAAPLTELMDFQMPKLDANGQTSLGAALSLLADKVQTELVKTTPEMKGDWKPLVFLMTDGMPTDDCEAGIAAIKKCKFGIFVACAAGEIASGINLKKGEQSPVKALLQRITPTIAQLNTMDEDKVKAFFKWVSASIGVSSVKVTDSGKEVSNIDELPPPPEEVIIS